MVLVVVRGPDTVVQGYGETSKGNGSEPQWEIIAASRLHNESLRRRGARRPGNSGKVRLTDPLTLYAQGATVPSFGERQITLLDAEQGL
jgi:hypothetical protein